MAGKIEAVLRAAIAVCLAAFPLLLGALVICDIWRDQEAVRLVASITIGNVAVTLAALILYKLLEESKLLKDS